MRPDTGRILVVDDNAELRQLVKAVLGRAGYQTVEVETGEEALELSANERPRLAILDVSLPGTSGYVVCNELRQTHGPDLPIMFLSGERKESFDRVAGLLIGADEYLVKPFDPDELTTRVSRMLERSDLLQPRVPKDDPFGLTPREREVLGLLVQGLNQVDIAGRLHLSPKTVGTHIQRILEKMGVKSRTQAVAYAARERMFQPLAR